MAAVSSCQAGRRCSRPGGGSVIGARWPGSSRVHPCGAGPGGPRGRAAGGAGRRSRGRGNERRGLGRPGGGSVSRGGGGRGGGRTFRGPGSRGGGACYRLRCCESAPAGGDSGFRRRKASGDRSLVRVAGLVMSGEIRFTGPHPAGHPGVALGWRLSRGSGARVAWARRLPPGACDNAAAPGGDACSPPCPFCSANGCARVDAAARAWAAGAAPGACRGPTGTAGWSAGEGALACRRAGSGRSTARARSFTAMCACLPAPQGDAGERGPGCTRAPARRPCAARHTGGGGCACW